ncbi:MAG: general secretion pathway protein GspD [Proteobacteria bacterium]|nr:general secretion pathway protein GspD [Pseudomonadota bacterium]
MIGRPIKFLTAALCASTVILTGCAADRLHHEGMKSVEHGNYEDGVARLQKAVEKEPDNLTFRLDLRARSEEAVQKLIAEADAARAAGKREEAAAAYRRVLAINPANDRALRGVEGVDADRRHTDAVAAAQKDVAAKDLDHAETMLRAVLAEDPGFGPAVSLQQRIDQIRGPVQATPKLRTKDNRPVTLQFRDASTKMVFEVLSRQTGVNFIFDKDVKADGKTTIFVQDVPIETAIDLVLGQNQLAREVLSSNMVMIYPNTPAKQKDYQDEIVKTFYLSDADPKQVQTLIKTIVNPKAMFVDDRTGTLVVRDTPEVIRMTEKLINSIDLPDAEVMLEVEVLEITHSNVLNLGIQYPAGASFDMTPQGGGKGLTLADFTKQGKSTINVSSIGATLNALKTAGLTNTLASPRIRSRNHEKAKILIGQRVPVITNSVTPTTSSAAVTGSVQYLEVGLTLEVEPTVHRDGDVAIKLQLEVSSILNQVTTPSGTVAYQIGTRNANTLLQLKDGETQILAGISTRRTRSQGWVTCRCSVGCSVATRPIARSQKSSWRSRRASSVLSGALRAKRPNSGTARKVVHVVRHSVASPSKVLVAQRRERRTIVCPPRPIRLCRRPCSRRFRSPLRPSWHRRSRAPLHRQPRRRGTLLRRPRSVRCRLLRRRF